MNESATIPILSCFSIFSVDFVFSNSCSYPTYRNFVIKSLDFHCGELQNVHLIVFYAIRSDISPII